MRQLSFPSIQRYREVAPFVLRGTIGVIFTYHGWLKFQGGIEGVEGFFASVGAPIPAVTAPAVTFLELIGGVALIVGLLTRLFAGLFALLMIGSTYLVRLDIGLIGQQATGAELDLAIWAGMVAVFLLGPGILALDRRIGVERR